ncbi:L,D-transpeptidase catalytic domain [Thiorhodovibrio winogradskyi]|uniref:L,D-transpeptidase catalytic domain n=1 Tax=Thiorhodovibrio winogradskyi TaxID=77007 RepID=A0ABZ0SE53_9GAMM|nr:L,D-transpeptidase [Thiorhodovibrio winogradskyi]
MKPPLHLSRDSRAPAAGVALWVSLAEQRLALLSSDGTCRFYPISTALNGPGECNGSGCTPLGLHRVRLKIGDGCPPGTVFRARRPTGEIYSPALAAKHPNRDWILTRILWLTGLEAGRNRGGDRDTLRRFIYIHGCPDTEPMGVPRSHGCIRMRDPDLLELFARTPRGAQVRIDQGPLPRDLCWSQG